MTGGGPAVGIDVGGTKLLGVALDPGGSVVADAVEDSPRTGPELTEAVIAVTRRLAGGAPAAIGVGVPGLVDAMGTLLYAPNLPGASGTAVGASLGAAFPGVGAWVGNDATAACWAEHEHGTGRGIDDMLMVTLGTGIGGGLVQGGRLVEGAHRFAGEFGHMMVDPSGPACPCGRNGCWERFASGSGLGRLGREAARRGAAPYLLALAEGDPEGVKGEHVTAGALNGDIQSLELMAQFGWWVAAGLANLVNLLDPRAVVLGGGLVSAGEFLLQPTRRAFMDLVEAPHARPPVRILAASLGPRAGAVGAALLAGA